MVAQKYKEKVDRLYELNKKELVDLSDEEITEFLETRKELMIAFEPLIESMVDVTKRIVNCISDVALELSDLIDDEENY